jgi:hypothetical protein
MEATVKRIVIIAACSLGVSACSSMPGAPSFMASEPSPITLQFDSKPQGVEARLPTGQSCHTPCALPVTSTEFAVTFTHPGYLPQTVAVRAAPMPEQNNPFAGPPELRLLPNPVFAELQRSAPPPRARNTPAVAQSKPKPAQRAAPTAMAPPPPAPAPAPASPWPPPPR